MNKLEIYRRSFSASLLKAFSDGTALDRTILYGVRMLGNETKPATYEELMNRFQLSELIMSLITLVTPRRLVAIFPIEKDYNGQQFGVKDYFSTIEAINEHGWDEPICDPLDFLWDYENPETREFLVNYMSLASDLRRTQGYPGILEEWAEANGVPIYTMHTDANGNQYLVDQNGRSKPVKKERSKHLRLVY
jgi:hypothetical protein